MGGRAGRRADEQTGESENKERCDCDKRQRLLSISSFLIFFLKTVHSVLGDLPEKARHIFIPRLLVIPLAVQMFRDDTHR